MTFTLGVFAHITFDVEFSKHVQKCQAVENDKHVQVFGIVAVLGEESDHVEIKHDAELDLEN